MKHLKYFNENTQIVDPKTGKTIGEEKFITPEGKKRINLAQKSFPSLMKYYSPEMGLFSFTYEELIKDIKDIAGWMELTQDSLIYEIENSVYILSSYNNIQSE